MARRLAPGWVEVDLWYLAAQQEVSRPVAIQMAYIEHMTPYKAEPPVTAIHMPHTICYVQGAYREVLALLGLDTEEAG